jgi:glucose/arabinose dehydrogenase
LKEQFGRLRDVAQGPDGAFYVLTNNRDAFDSPTREDDRLLRVTVE